MKLLSVRLSIMTFLQFFIWGTWLITLGTYMLQTLEFSGRQVGLVYATNAIAAIISPVIMGVLADKLFSENHLMVVLHFFGGIFMLLAFNATEFNWFFTFMLGFNLCYVPTFGLSAAFCFHHLQNPEKEYPPIRVWGTIAWIVTSVMLSFFMMEATATPLLIGGIASIVFACYNLTLPPTPIQPALTWADFKGEDVRRLLRDKSLIVLLICDTLICIPAAFYYSFINPFLNENGMTDAAAKMSVGQVFEILVVLAMPWFFSRLKLKTIFFWGLAVWGLRYFVFAFARPNEVTEIFLYLAIAVQGFAFAWTSLAAQLYVNSKVPAFLRSTAQGIVTFSAFGLGSFIGSFLAGEVVNHYALTDGTYNWEGIFLVPAVFGCVVAAGFWWWFPGQTRNKLL